MDNEHIGEVIVKLKEDIKALSDEEVLNTYGNLTSAQTIYTANLKDDLHLLMEFIDPNGKHNRLDQFSTLNRDSTSFDEIVENAKWYIERIQDYEVKKLKTLTVIVENNSTSFNDDDLANLHSILKNLNSSIEMQISIFQEFNYITIDDGLTISEKMDRAINDFEAAENSLTDLELNFE